MTGPVLLQTDGLTKRYGRVTVLDSVSIEIRAGEIHGFLGANGAGKSTLCKIISGLTDASDGSMRFEGEDFRPRSKHDAESRGVEMVQQELNLVGTLSVAENLFLNRLPTRCGILRVGHLRRQAREVLDRFGLDDVPPDVAVDTLGVGRQQMVEIASALARDCKLLILDEPTAALSVREVEKLFGHLNELREQGVAMIYISHRLDEVASLTDRVSVLRDGQLIATKETKDLSTDDMVDLMSGEAQTRSSAGFISKTTDRTAIRVRELTCGLVREVSFEVRRGERFGIAGLVGSGRTELLRAIFGADVAASGVVELGDHPKGHRFRSPCEATRAGLAMVTEDRKANGLLLSQSILMNASLSSLAHRFASFGCVRQSQEQDETLRRLDELAASYENLDQVVGTLSGGNQQKVAVAKWLIRDADVFLFDEPTRGIDVAARRRIYQLIESLVDREKACVVVSSDLEELMEICDTIGVMSHGRLVEQFSRGNWSHEKIIQASFAEYVA
ncbi:MAG: sugar ABC transporter ATP-binding protein [Planctomycetota bacterium]